MYVIKKSWAQGPAHEYHNKRSMIAPHLSYIHRVVTTRCSNRPVQSFAFHCSCAFQMKLYASISFAFKAFATNDSHRALNSMPKVNTNSYINLSAYFPSHIPHLLLLASAYVLLKHATSTHYLNIYFFFNITLIFKCVNQMIAILFTKLRLDT